MDKKYLCYSKEEDKLFVSEKPIGECIGKNCDVRSDILRFTNGSSDDVSIVLNNSLFLARLYVNGISIVDFARPQLSHRSRITFADIYDLPTLNRDKQYSRVERLYNRIIDVYNCYKKGFHGDIEVLGEDINFLTSWIKNLDTHRDPMSNFEYLTYRFYDLCATLNKLGITPYNLFEENYCALNSTIEPTSKERIKNAAIKLMHLYIQTFKKYHTGIQQKTMILYKTYSRVCQIAGIKENCGVTFEFDAYYFLAEGEYEIDDYGEYKALVLANKFIHNNVYIWTTPRFITPISEEGYNIIMRSHETPDYYMAKRKGECYSILSISESGELNEPIPTNYVDARGFSHGYATVKDNTGKWGIINVKAEVIYECIYDEIFEIADDPIIRATLDGKTQYLELDWRKDVGPQTQHTGITSISCSNFRRLERLNLSLSSVNFIVGKNNAGKSTFIRLIEKIFFFISWGKISLELSDFYKKLDIDKMFNSSKDLTFGKSAKDETIDISICIAEVIFSFSICKDKISSFSITHNDVTVGYDAKEERYSVRYGHVEVYDNASINNILECNLFSVPYRNIWNILRYNPQLDYIFTLETSRDSFDNLSKEDKEYWIEGTEHFNDNDSISYAVAHCDFVSSIHVFFADERELKNVISNYSQTLDSLNIQRRNYSTDLASNIDKYIRHWMGLWLNALEIGDEVSEDFNVSKNGCCVDFKDMGTGSKHFYILLIKIAQQMIENINRPTFIPVLMVEEPEQNLHPMLQSKLADFFLDVVEMQERLIEGRFY